MSADIFHLTAVNGGLLLLVMLPFVPIVRYLIPKEQWPVVALTAVVFGCSLQAVLGMLWTHTVGKFPYGEVCVYGLVWLALMIWSWHIHKKREFVYDSYLQDERYGYLPLLIILSASFAVRLIHPLQVAYLGQSDAYTHLNYLHNIVDSGSLINPVYPPGYHWVLALPVLVFSIDPYLVARFGGAFFGVGLVLAVYVLLEQLFSRRTALFGSFCCGCFPLMNLLIKTGVGSFANQMGLMLIPAILYFYYYVISKKDRLIGRLILPIIALCGLVASVPMMMLHVLLIIATERLAAFLRGPKGWMAGACNTILIIVPAVLLLFFHLSQVGAGHRFETAVIVVGEGERREAVKEKIINKVQSTAEVYTGPENRKLTALITKSPYFELLIDYISIKRIHGFGNTYLNAVGWLLATLFLSLFLIGFVKKHGGFLLIGLWGFLTTVQASTGFLQFSAYQREGWSLLIAVCCLSGILASLIFRYGAEYRLFRFFVVMLMGASLLLTVKRPPMHAAIRSDGEDQLVRTVRFFGKDSIELIEICTERNDGLCKAWRSLDSHVPLTLVTRRFTGWGNQGEVMPNVLQRHNNVETMVVGDWKRSSLEFDQEHQYVVLIDQQGKLSGSDIISAFAMVTPAMVAQSMRNREKLYRANEKLQEYINGLSRDEWKIREVALSRNLKAVTLVPIPK